MWDACRRLPPPTPPGPMLYNIGSFDDIDSFACFNLLVYRCTTMQNCMDAFRSILISASTAPPTYISPPPPPPLSSLCYSLTTQYIVPPMESSPSEPKSLRIVHWLQNSCHGLGSSGNTHHFCTFTSSSSP